MGYCMYTHPWLWSIPTIFLIYLPLEYLPPAVVLRFRFMALCQNKKTEFIVLRFTKKSEAVPRYTTYNGICRICETLLTRAYELLHLPARRS